MSLDVCILAGGYGTRLRGIWDGPKCLVPVKGNPVLQHILEQLSKAPVERIYLFLGHRSGEVLDWFYCKSSSLRVEMLIEDYPTGTTKSVLHVATKSFSRGSSLMVINGDTVPEYLLTDLVWAYRGHDGPVAAWSSGSYAGAAIIDQSLFRLLLDCKDKNWEAVLEGVHRYEVNGFLDVGTEEGFNQAQKGDNT